MSKAAKQAPAAAPVTVKKYANRRLYNTATSSYVTLDDLCRLIGDGVEFSVLDARSGADITGAVLTQIVVEKELGGGNLFPIAFLRRLIAYYGDDLETVLARYLEAAMSAFHRDRDLILARLGDAHDAFDDLLPFDDSRRIGRRNMASFRREMNLDGAQGNGAQGNGRPGHDHDNPGHDGPGRENPGHDNPGHDNPGHDNPGHDNNGRDADRLTEMLGRLDAMQAQLEALVGAGVAPAAPKSGN